MINCNPETGACELPSAASAPAAGAPRQQRPATLHYVGDPMCSWCWGLSAELKQIALHCQKQGIGFSVTMGGLRPGGAFTTARHVSNSCLSERGGSSPGFSSRRAL